MELSQLVLHLQVKHVVESRAPSATLVLISGRLSIHLEKCFDGKIITSDKIQVYKGLGITNNKVQPLYTWILSEVMISPSKHFQRLTEKRLLTNTGIAEGVPAKAS